MTIELQFNSVILQYDELQEQFPELLPMVNSYLPQKKLSRRKKRKKKITVASMIDEIIDNINRE